MTLPLGYKDFEKTGWTELHLEMKYHQRNLSLGCSLQQRNICRSCNGKSLSLTTIIWTAKGHAMS